MLAVLGAADGAGAIRGRRVAVKRPRVRTADRAREVPLAAYEHFADRDPLSRVVLERMLAGVSTRRYERTQEPVGGEIQTRARSTSKSSCFRACALVRLPLWTRTMPYGAFT